MSLRYRRILFAFFVLLFILLVPIVLLYATGHSVNWRRFSLETSASVLINSDPSGATVFINGATVQNEFLTILPLSGTKTTPSRLKDLAPGEYTIRLEKNGYWPWEERFRLSPGEAFNFGVVHLYSQSKPELLIESASNAAKTSPDGSAVALLNSTTLHILNTESEEDIQFRLPSASRTNLVWSSDSQRLVVDRWIVDRNQKTLTELASGFSNPRWNRRNSSTVYYLNGANLFSFNVENKKETLLTLQMPAGLKIIDYDIYDNQAYIVARDARGNDSLLIGQLDKPFSSLPLSGGHYSFIENDFAKPLLVSQNTLYIIDEPLPLFKQPRLLEISSRFANGRSHGSSFTYSTGLELRQWDNENQEYLLTRFGSPISALWPLNKSAAIVAALSDSLRLYVNGRAPFILTLANATNISELALSRDESKLYFVGTFQDTSGLFRLTLNEK